MTKFIEWDVAEPMSSITKVGAGKKLFALVQDEVSGAIVAIPVAKMPLRDVVELADKGIKFIETV